jgi:hypothetical protein
MTFKVGWNVDCIVVVAHSLICTATSQLVNWTEPSSWSTGWTQSESESLFDQQSVLVSSPFLGFWPEICFRLKCSFEDPRRLVNCLEADPSENTARNNTCFVVIVGYQGNSVYRAVAWIPICVSVTSVAIGNLWEYPMEGSHSRTPAVPHSWPRLELRTLSYLIQYISLQVPSLRTKLRE